MTEKNMLTNSGYLSDPTAQKAIKGKRKRKDFFHAFCRRLFTMANRKLMKEMNIKILKITFWDMENGEIKTITEKRF